MKHVTVLLAKPRGFCAGVARAIQAIETALEKWGPPVYVLNELVHNSYVLADLRGRGVIFVASLAEVPEGSVVFFSAHGVPPSTRAGAAERRLFAIDATCPLVAKVHQEAVRYARQDLTILLVGDPNHDEVIGTRGEAPDRIRIVENIAEASRVSVDYPEKVAVLTQTTLGLDEAGLIVDSLRARFPGLSTPAVADVCYATQNRQLAVKKICEKASLLLIVGSPQSSNAVRLGEVATRCGVESHLLESPSDIDQNWFVNGAFVGVTAGASSPERLVEATLARLGEFLATTVEEVEVASEKIAFPAPPELNGIPAAGLRKEGPAHAS